MRVDAFRYELPPSLIAQRPLPERDLARLMVLPRGSGPPAHKRVSELPQLLAPGSVVVLNDTRVIPARLVGRKRGSGGRCELFLLRLTGSCEIEAGPGSPRPGQSWKALGKAGKPLRVGTEIEVQERGSSSAARLLARVQQRDDDGSIVVALWTPSGEPIEDALPACGRVPLPPYIKREPTAEDSDRYQTVYATHDGAVAAPTAGLHLSRQLLDRLLARAFEISTLTLHVGAGTFQPVHVQDLDDHEMHAERYVVSEATAAAVADARSRGAAVVAIGTTTARALESAADSTRPGCVRAQAGETRLLIQPGYTWRVVDVLLTNFHLPGTTLLALVCSFAGTQHVLDAYRTAVEQRYRFFSYGDAMLLWRHG